MNLSEIISELVLFKTGSVAANKAEIELRLAAIGGFTKNRSVYSGDGFALRISEANTGSFSNVVLSLSTLQRYDRHPMVICIVRPDRLDFRLANTTFLKRISHSSHNLWLDNVRGSFLGHDLVDEYEGIPNRPENFEQLAAIHAEFEWIENLERLVGTTNLIAAKLRRFAPTDGDVRFILAAPERAASAVESDAFLAIERQLIATMEQNRQDLLRSASLDNINIRGSRIEEIITGDINAHRLDDMVFPLPGFGHLIVDIKTKLLDKASAPKAYNIDKMLRLLSEPGSVFAFFFIGLRVNDAIAKGRLVSMFDHTIITATRIQHHWAGRASRGVTQLTGDISAIFDSRRKPTVDLKESVALLISFLEK